MSAWGSSLLELWLALAVVLRALGLRELYRLARRSAPAERAAPRALAGIALVRPLYGAPASLEHCLESLCRAARTASVPIHVGFEDPSDPCAAVLQRVRARWPDVEMNVRAGEGPPGANRKVANQLQILRGVQADLLILTDADVEVPEDFVRRMTEPFSDPRVGLVTCPYRSVPGGGLPSRLDALLTNLCDLPRFCLALRVEGLHFGLGAAMAVRRDALTRAGGLEALLDRAADDYGLAHNVETAGYRLAWSPVMLDHHLECETFSGTLSRHLRWARVTRHSRLGGYLGASILHGMVPAALLAAWGATAGAPGLTLLLGWWALEALGLWPSRALLGLRARDLVWLPVIDALSLGVFLGGLVGRARGPGAQRIGWRWATTRPGRRRAA